ncbi:YggS family pyridoxal phosphate-dependent enzyme [Nocardioides daejeonensis]|uniref:YggS family pyridoxal phosphate-dependent enzyme n=1 Tax=Nocardioides daejeonensis TaxID=1046556 RepID=UPI000D750464|nr:YggS family pyridoxal phosphate-dependent enzyme [Nocardioides daejeonensis]
MTRREELAAGLAATRERIAAACRSVGRDPGEVTLTVVTKYFPASDVRLLADLGVTDVGENRHQEAEAKAAETADLGLRWHYIGGLQSNKAAAVARYADMVESLDRPKLVAGLSRGAQERGIVLPCLVQVSLDPPEQRDGRAGVRPEEIGPLAEAVVAADGLRLAGLMAVAPLGADADAAFAELAELAAALRRDHPEATVLSAGMSGDLEEAVKHGATHVRIGRAVLGERPAVQ